VREREILNLTAQGRGTSEIAARLVLSPNTARNYASSLICKPLVADWARAIIRARGRAGLVVGGVGRGSARSFLHCGEGSGKWAARPQQEAIAGDVRDEEGVPAGEVALGDGDLHFPRRIPGCVRRLSSRMMDRERPLLGKACPNQEQQVHVARLRTGKRTLVVAGDRAEEDDGEQFRVVAGKLIGD
jgi:hypothetical protein